KLEGRDPEDAFERQFRPRSAIHARRLEDRLEVSRFGERSSARIDLGNVEEDRLADHRRSKRAEQGIRHLFIIGEERTDLVSGAACTKDRKAKNRPITHIGQGPPWRL